MTHPSIPFSFIERYFTRLNRWYERLTQIVLQNSLENTPPRRGWVHNFGAAALNVTVMTLIILPLHLLLQNLFSPMGNISLLYLPAIIWLAATDSLKTAIIASVLATIVYEFFFLQPLYHFTIDEPSEWLSLSGLLLVSVVIAFFTVELRRREQFAAESQQRTATLYKLSQEIATTTKLDVLMPRLTQRFCEDFRSEGVNICALWLPQETETLAVSAVSSADATIPMKPYDATDYQAHAALAFRTERIDALIEGTNATYFIPLKHSTRSEGILSISGPPRLISLFAQIGQPSMAVLPHEKQTHRIAAEQFAAFCDQVSLALERARLQQEAIHVAALRESDRLKDALLGSVTHDLRTPLTAIQTAGSALQHKSTYTQDADYVMLVEKIMGSARRLGSIVDNLLLLTRLEGNAATMHHVMFPINDVVAIALDELDAAGQLSQHTLVVDIAEDPLEAVMDHLAIERVIINLVENAVKYSPPMSTITAERHAAQERLLVCVHDEGIGIPSDELEAIFLKFHRLQQPLPWLPHELPKGTGLGLAVCAGIIQEHHGTIWAEPSPQGGTTFCFYLPTTSPS